MEKWQGAIDSPERMLEAIRHYGIVPFFKCGIPGWSIEEMTAKDCWFMSSQVLGPWDWKIDVIQSGEIAYGKYLRRKAGFATAECYGHLLNHRRSQQRYRQWTEGGTDAPRTVDDRLNALMASVTLEIVKEHGSIDSGELRSILEKRVPADARMGVGGHMEKYLLPKIKKTAQDFVMGYLDMGCYTLTGGFQRVFRGPNAEYSGWQRASVTTPEELFGGADDGKKAADSVKSAAPFWARFIEDSEPSKEKGFWIPDCTPEESYQFLTERITGFFPGCGKELEKLLL